MCIPRSTVLFHFHFFLHSLRQMCIPGYTVLFSHHLTIPFTNSDWFGKTLCVNAFYIAGSYHTCYQVKKRFKNFECIDYKNYVGRIVLPYHLPGQCGLTIFMVLVIKAIYNAMSIHMSYHTNYQARAG